MPEKVRRTFSTAGEAADSPHWALVAALVVPVALTWLAPRRALQTPSGGV